MITKCWSGWHKVGIDIFNEKQKSEMMHWCKQNIGFTDHDTWVYQRTPHIPCHGYFSFKDEKWAVMFALRWA